MQTSWSTPTNHTSGFAFGNVVRTGIALKPLTTIRFLPASMNDWRPAGSSLMSLGTMYGGFSAPIAAAPSTAPAYEYWLNPLSSIEPISVWTASFHFEAVGAAVGASVAAACEAAACDAGAWDVAAPLQPGEGMDRPAR